MVRGTKWLVEDRCDSTLTKVQSGRVAVRDFVKKKCVIVRGGKRYAARASGGRTAPASVFANAPTEGAPPGRLDSGAGGGKCRPVLRSAILALATCLALLGAAPAFGQEVAPPFNESYTWHDLGQPPDVPGPLGGLTLKAGTTDRLLIGGVANEEVGALYEIGLVRDDGGHIVGFSGAATRFADAAYNDGGVAYGPDGVLFLARWPANQLGQMKPGSVITDKIVDMAPLDVAPSLASLQFVPGGQPGERSLKLASWDGGQWYDAAVAPDGKGTFDVTRVTAVPDSKLEGGPEGFVYVAAGSPQFDRPSLLVSEYSAGNVAAYEVNENGDPIVSTRRNFIVGLEGAEGAFIDPATGDFLFSTFGGSDRVIVVRGFAKPPSLEVRTKVINDDGGALLAEAFTVRVKEKDSDVDGIAQPGSESGALYSVEVLKTYTVSVDPITHYETTIGGDCSAGGTIEVQEGAQPVCTITADDETALAVGDVRAAEGDAGVRAFTFSVSLSSPIARAVRVDYATADETALAPSDYTAAAGNLEFAPGETAKLVSITVNGDADVEADERFRVNLSGAGGARIADSQGVGTITNDDVATVLQQQQQQQQPPPQQPQQQEEQLPPPEAGETVNAEPKSGTVTIKLKGTNKFVELKEGEQVPVGSVLDTTKGRVTLVAASDKSGGTATADFYDGIFEVGQTKGSKPITTLELVEKLSCATGKASAAAKRKKKRRLWGDGSGSFRTEGSYSSATVRGTKWLVEDQCKSTLTKVTRGKVAVRDFVKRKTVIVRAGKQYVARARR